jgi:hypothetical protein
VADDIEEEWSSSRTTRASWRRCFSRCSHSPRHSTLSRATLNAFALLIVLNIVVYLHGEEAARQSTPDLRLAAQTRAANTRQTNTSNVAHAAAYKELASDMFGTSALNDSTILPRFKRRHELSARRLMPQSFVNVVCA